MVGNEAAGSALRNTNVVTEPPPVWVIVTGPAKSLPPPRLMVPAPPVSRKVALVATFVLIVPVAALSVMLLDALTVSVPAAVVLSVPLKLTDPPAALLVSVLLPPLRVTTAPALMLILPAVVAAARFWAKVDAPSKSMLPAPPLVRLTLKLCKYVLAPLLVNMT